MSLHHKPLVVLFQFKPHIYIRIGSTTDYESNIKRKLVTAFLPFAGFPTPERDSMLPHRDCSLSDAQISLSLLDNQNILFHPH